MPLSRSQGCDGWKAVVPAVLRLCVCIGGGGVQSLNFANYVLKIWFQQKRLSISLNSRRHHLNKSRRRLETTSHRQLTFT